MAQVMLKPANVLKKAEDLIAVGQQAEALNVLHNTICHRRMRTHGWDPCAELIMLRYVKLCIELNKLRYLREGLSQYRTFTHAVNVASLAKVLKELRDTPEQKLSQLSEKPDLKTISEVDDLEAEESPENLLMSTLQVDDRDEASKAFHAALVCCWETYKIILDIIKYAPRIDFLYHETAQRALEFCRVHKRPTEFRRLCDLLRSHYVSMQKLSRRRPDYDSFLSPKSHLPTRIVQMSVAADLQLWSQCFQAANDVMALGLYEQLQNSSVVRDIQKHKLRSTLLAQVATFYEKLAQMFLVSNQKLFHAAATLRHLLHLRQHKKNLTETEQTRLSYSLVELEYQKHLSTMLAHANVPSRASMQNLIEIRGIVAASSLLVQEVYALIESDFDPMTISSNAQTLLNKMADMQHALPYLESLKQVIFGKLIHYLSDIYVTLSIDYFTKTICPASFISWTEAENLIVQMLDYEIIKIRFDYSRNLMIFAEGTHGGFRQSLGKQLVHVADTLWRLMPKMQIPGEPPLLREAETKAAAFYADFPAKLESESERLFLRNRIVANHRIMQEKEQQAREEARRVEEKEKQKKEELEEQSRREAAIKYQEMICRKEAQQQLKVETSKLIVREFKNLADKAMGKIVIKGRAIDEITVEQILSKEFTYEDYEKAVEELKTKEKQEKTRLYRQELRRVEHNVRAIRMEEAKVLDDWKEKMAEEEEILQQQVQREYASILKSHQEIFEASKAILEKNGNYLKEYAHKIYEERQQQRAVLSEERKKKLAKLYIQDKITRARERKAAHEKALEAKRKAKIAQEIKQKEAEEENRLNKIAAIQKQKQDEIDERLRREQAKNREAASGVNQNNRNYPSRDGWTRQWGQRPHQEEDQWRSGSDNPQAPPIAPRRYQPPPTNSSGYAMKDGHGNYDNRRDRRFDTSQNEGAWRSAASHAPTQNTYRPAFGTSVKPHTDDNEGFTTVNPKQKHKTANK